MVERIKSAAAQRGMSLTQLERALGFGVRTIYKWDKNSPSVEKVLTVANFLNVSLYWLVTGEAEANLPHSELIRRYERLTSLEKEKLEHFMDVCLIQAEDLTAKKGPAQRQIPVLGFIAEALPLTGLSIPTHYIPTKTRADYAMTVQDSSLEPYFSQGDYVLIQKTDSVRNGDMAVFYFNGNLICRQCLIQEGQTLLKPFGPASAPGCPFPGTGPDLKLQGRILFPARP